MNRPHRASRNQEERVADRFGGRRTPGSGNGIRKNDVRSEDWSFEMKYTGKKQYILKSAELKQGEKYALLDGREFAFGIEMDNTNWVVVAEDTFLRLVEGVR